MLFIMLDFVDNHDSLFAHPCPLTPDPFLMLRIGILGCARIVRRAIAGALHKTPSATFHALAGRNAATVAAWADEFGVPKRYDSYEALVADPDVDAVYIPLPNELHRPWVERCAAAGKHVLCEKPLALDVADALPMVDACRRAGVVLMEAFMWRHHPRVKAAIALLADGALGELTLVKMGFSFDIDRTDWRLDPARGGGALYDLGCYGINIARTFARREPSEIIARARYFKPGVDSTLGMLLRFPNQVTALLDCSFEGPSRNRFELVGTKGSIEFPAGVLPPECAQLILHGPDGAETVTLPAADQYAEMIECFCRSVAAGKLEPPAEDGLANMRVLQAVRDAAGEVPRNGL
jgi:xylose dehydrogenase (NAD/NADP)